jgi:hypothetical protein
VLVLLRLLFKLFRCQDKGLRELIYDYVTSDIRNMNQKARNEKVRSAMCLQTCCADPPECTCLGHVS